MATTEIATQVRWRRPFLVPVIRALRWPIRQLPESAGRSLCYALLRPEYSTNNGRTWRAMR